MENNRDKTSSSEKKSTKRIKLCIVCKQILKDEPDSEKKYLRKCINCRSIRKPRQARFIERTCSDCGRKFRVKYSNRQAVEGKGKNTKRKCQECKEIGESKGTIQPLSRPMFQCDMCGQKFDRKINMYAHMDKHRSDVTCRVCHIQFSRRNTLRKHLRVHFEKFICELCGYSTTNKTTFKHHEKMHNDVNNSSSHEIMHQIPQKTKPKEYKYPAVRGNFPCLHCGLIFFTKTTLIGHEKRQHESGNGFKCKYCGCQVFRQKEFREHVLTHSNKPLLFCHYPNCDFYHNTVKRLNMHVKLVHETKDNAFQCHTCKKLFKYRISMEKHLRNNRCVPLSVRKLNAAKKNVSKSTKLIESMSAEELERNAEIAKKQYLEIRGLKKIIEENGEEDEDEEAADVFKKEVIDVVVPKTEPASDYDDGDDNDNLSMFNGALSDHFERDAKSENGDEDDKNSISPSFVKIEVKEEPIEHEDFISSGSCVEIVTNMHTNPKMEHPSEHPALNPVVSLERLDPNLLRKYSKIKTETDTDDSDETDSEFHARPKRKKKKKKRGYMKHEQINDRVFCCKYCPEFFVLVKMLKEHERSFHKLDIEKSLTEIFTCDVCGKQFKMYKLLKVHIRFVHQSAPVDFSCPHCPSKYKHESYLKRHIREIHLGIKQFCCQFCGKAFKRKIQMQDHESRHGDPVTCHICGKLVVNLGTHIKTVHAEKKNLETFPCSICGKHFNKYVLKTHINNVHHKLHNAFTFDRPCVKCGKTFKRLEDLKRHDLLTHFEGTIKYCHYEGCDKIFKSTKLLNMHTREVHERMEVFTCAGCGKSFQSACGFRKHALKKHNMVI